MARLIAGIVVAALVIIGINSLLPGAIPALVDFIMTVLTGVRDATVNG